EEHARPFCNGRSVVLGSKIVARVRRCASMRGVLAAALVVVAGCDTGLVMGRRLDAGSERDSGAMVDASGARDAGLDAASPHDAAADAALDAAVRDAFAAPDTFTSTHGFVTTTGNEFMRDGARYRFVGVNLRGLP